MVGDHLGLVGVVHWEEGRSWRSTPVYTRCADPRALACRILLSGEALREARRIRANCCCSVGVPASLMLAGPTRS
jgi:hypothetical protein